MREVVENIKTSSVVIDQDGLVAMSQAIESRNNRKSKL